MNEIETDRLILRLVPLAGLAATVAEDRPACRRLIAADLPEEWFAEAWVAALRLDQWREDPRYAPWSIRAMILKETGQAVGNINFHGRPEPFSHQGETGTAVEMGYTVFAPWRRRGLAAEAVTALSGFAHGQGARWVRLSISPGNAASLALARRLGARRIGSQVDEIDGPEDVYLLDAS